MKRLITAVLALTLLGGTAASAHMYYNPGPFPPGYVQVRHGHGPKHHGRHWVRGERFMVPYGSYIVVTDYPRYHLRRPPVGYRWVSYGGDFILVSRMNGMIIDVRIAL